MKDSIEILCVGRRSWIGEIRRRMVERDDRCRAVGAHSIREARQLLGTLEWDGILCEERAWAEEELDQLREWIEGLPDPPPLLRDGPAAPGPITGRRSHVSASVERVPPCERVCTKGGCPRGCPDGKQKTGELPAATVLEGGPSLLESAHALGRLVWRGADRLAGGLTRWLRRAR